MSEKEKTILIVIIAAAMLCGCFVMSCCAASLFFITHTDKDTIRELISNETSSSFTNPNSETVNSPSSTDTDTNGLSKEELLIIEETEKTRNLHSDVKLAPIYKTETELRNYLIDQMKDVSDEDLKKELDLYYLLGFAPKDFDLRQFYIDMYTEQIAGFYDPEENQMYLVKDISPYENALTLAHEYTHFLQYNNPAFSNTLHYDDDYCEDHGEICMIIDALVEGDATLTESLMDPEEILGFHSNDANSSVSSSESVFDSSPKFFQDSLLFPYVYGFDFTAYHYMKGGFDSVNDLFINLPQSVEQIMHPEKYLKDAPIDVTLEPFRSIIMEDFEIIREDVMNEADIKMVLSDGYDENWQLSERQASTAAEGWGGGSFLLAEDDEELLFFSKIIMDTEKDAEEAETLFALYADKRFGVRGNDDFWKGENSSTVHLIRQGDVLYWMILPEDFETESFIDLIQKGSVL